MKGFLFILCLWCICKSTFAQDGTITFQITIKNGSNLEAPDIYGITKDDFVWEIKKVGDGCVQNVETSNPGAINWSHTQKATTFRINLNVFNSCGGWKVGEPMELKMTINKPGSPLDGAIGICSFAGKAGALIMENGVVIEAVSRSIGVSTNFLTLREDVISGNVLILGTTGESKSGMVKWGLIVGGTIEGLMPSEKMSDFPGLLGDAYRRKVK